MSQCLKCGREVSEKAAFCDACIQAMEAYPVKPGTVIHLQPRPQNPERKNEVFRETVDKQLLVRAKSTIRWLVALSLVLAALLLTATAMLFQSTQEISEAPAIGRNYTTTQTQP